MTESKLRVLLVDDNEYFREPLAEWLEDQEMVVELAESGEEALRLVLDSAQEYDVILMDQELPGMSGIEAMSRIREELGEIPVIMFTGKAPAAGVQALKQGAYRYMLKPFDNEELASVIRSVRERDVTLQKTARTVCQLLEVPVSIVWVLDRAAGCFRPSGWVGDVDLEYRENVHLPLESASVQQLLHRSEPLFLPDVRNEQVAPLYTHRDKARERGWISLLSAPMHIKDTTVGIIDAYTLNKHTFTEENKVLIGILADQAAASVRNYQLFERSQALLEVTQKIAGTSEPDEMLELILQRGLELVGTDIGWLYLVNKRAQTLESAKSRGISETEAKMTRAIGEGITGWVAKYGIPQNVRDVKHDSRYIHAKGPDIESEIVVPLKRGSEVIGVLTAKSTFPNAFTDDDMALLMSLAAQAAIVVERTRLTDRLYNVSRLVLSEEYSELAKYAVEAVRDLTGAEAILWEMSDREGEQGQVLRVAAGSGSFDQGYLHTAETPITPDSSITSVALAKGKPIIRKDILDELEAPGEPRFHNLEAARRREWRSFMTVPLFGSHGEWLGSFSLYEREIGSFGESQIELMQTFADQAAIGIQSAKRLATIRQLNEIGQSLTTLPRSSVVLHETLNHIASAAITALRADVVDLYEYRTDVAEFVLPPVMVGKRREHELAPKGILHDDVIMGVVRDGEPLYATDAQHDPRLTREWDSSREERPKNRFVIREGIVSSAGIPVTAEGEVLGVLFVSYRYKRDFDQDPDLKQQISAFANFAGIAIQNARLLEKERALRQQAETLRESHRAITSTVELRERAGKILDELRGLVEYRTASLQSIEGDTRSLLAGRGFEEDTADPWFTRRISRDPLVFRIVQTREPLVLSDVSAEDDWGGYPGTEDVKSWVGVPLIHAQEVIGLLTLDHDTVGHFGSDIEDKVASFVKEATGAIWRAQRFDIARRRVRELELLQSVSNEIACARDVNQILQQIVDGAIKLTNSLSAVIYLVANDGRSVVDTYQAPPSFAHPKPRLDKEQGITRQVLADGKIMIFEDVEQDSFVNPVLHGHVGSMAAVPLTLEDQVIGVLYVNARYPHHYTETEVSLLTTLTSQASQAIRNARHQRILSELNKVSQALLAVHEPDRLLRKIAQAAREVLRADIVVLHQYFQDRGDVELPPVTVGSLRHKKTVEERSRERPYHKSAVYQVINLDTPFYAKNGKEDWADLGVFGYQEDNSDTFIIREGIASSAGFPLISDGERVGALFLNYRIKQSFPPDMKQHMELFASAAALAVRSARLYERINQSLNRQLQDLQVLTEIARTVSNLNIDQMLDLVYQLMGQIMNLRDAQVQFAFFDEEQNKVSFPLAVEKNDGETIDLVRRGKREAQYRKPGEDETVEQFEPRAQREPPGLNEYVIRTNKPLLIVEKFEDTATQLGIQVWPTFGRLNRPTDSWLGVPMIVGCRVIGVISVQSLEQEHAFDDEHVQILTAVANQAAVAIENARLYEQLKEKIKELELAQTKIAQTEALMTRMSIAADFVHRVNNLAGTIPIWVDMIKDNIDTQQPRDQALAKYLARIEANTVGLLRAAEQLKSSPVKEDVEIASVLNSLVRQALVQTPADIEIQLDCDKEFPKIRAVPAELAQALWNIMENGIDAMPKGGKLTIKAETVTDAANDRWIQVQISDQGKGIEEKSRDMIFSPFYTTKPTHMGYGLWRSKHIIEQVHGSIDVEGGQQRGATFVVRLPIPREASQNE